MRILPSEWTLLVPEVESYDMWLQLSGIIAASGSRKKKKHPMAGVDVAREAGLPDGVLDVIECHAGDRVKNAKTVEAVIVHHADFACLDAVKI